MNRQDCSTNPAHNQWVQLASGLAQGMYRLNVNSTVDAGNGNVGAENMCSIWVGSSGAKARVYGGGKWSAYTNLDAARSTFYLAQIDAVHAGKTMVIELFDPGDRQRQRAPADPQPGRQRLQLRRRSTTRRQRPHPAPA